MSISRRDNRRFHRIVIPYLVYTRCTSCTLADWVCPRRWISTVLTRHRMNHHRRWTTHLRDFNLWLWILLLVVVRNTTSLIGEPDQTILRSIPFENISSIYYHGVNPSIYWLSERARSLRRYNYFFFLCFLSNDLLILFFLLFSLFLFFLGEVKRIGLPADA